jgi:sugar phosphate permease
MAVALVPESASEAPSHSPSFKLRRFANWFPLGLTYAFLYMGRYNLNVAQGALGRLMTPEDFGVIFGAGTVIYGCAFLLNGPLTDRLGGRWSMLLAAAGAAVANLGMGAYIHHALAVGTISNASLRLWLSVLYALNMYFQSFGAVAIIKVNASWFHVRERGGFSGIFGTMISSGIFLAFTVNGWILDGAKKLWPTLSDAARSEWVFFVPAALLLLLFAVESALLKDRPSHAGHVDFDTGDASSGEADNVTYRQVLVRVLTNPIILTVGIIEFCTGVLRHGIQNTFPMYADEVLALPGSHLFVKGNLDWTRALGFLGVAAVLFVWASRASGRRRAWLFMSGGLVALVPFVTAGWGGLLFVAGVIAGNVAGYVSDLFFQSRRAPAAGGFYALLFVCSVAMVFLLPHTRPVVAHSRTPGLEDGDVVLSVAGKGDLKDWREVREAFARVPARCLGGAQWDVTHGVCSTSPAAVDASLPVSTGVIPVVVERHGTRLTVDVKDPRATMRAGEQRKLDATPQTSPSPYWLGGLAFLMMLGVIGVHGLLSGTATMDFGGRKGAATATGLIDGFVYLGTAFQSVTLGYLVGKSWTFWPWFLMPFSLVGFLLCVRIWNAKPQGKRLPASPPAPGDEQPSLAPTGTGR